jgi:hypothetical protein
MSKRALKPGTSRRLKARRGSLVVTAFVFVVAISMMAFGIHQMLKSQLEQSATLKAVSLSKLQAFYLAEMGVNYWMYTANQNLNTPFPQPAAIGTMDFKTKVAMVRTLSGGVATCAPGATAPAMVTAGYPPYKVDATLTTGDGTFTKTVYFNASKLSGGQYVLSSYRTK